MVDGLGLETRVDLPPGAHRPEVEFLAFQADPNPAEEDTAVVRVSPTRALGDGLAVDRVDDTQVGLIGLIRSGRRGHVVRRQVGGDDLARDQHLDGTIGGPEADFRGWRGQRKDRSGETKNQKRGEAHPRP